MDLSFYKGKTVLVTGHTGFKGSWMCEVLVGLGADVIGYALPAQTKPALFDILGLGGRMTSVIGDIRDLDKLKDTLLVYKPEIVIHMAAQPIVRTSYEEPVYTYETNVMGTVNILEAIRLCDSVKSFVNVTTDKVYQNNEWVWGYREGDILNGYDPYSNSKSCSELITDSYRKSFFYDNRVSISTCRAGNVIGGGDFSRDRIVPDCVRGLMEGHKINVRNPFSTRPYQHVLEPVCAYLMIAMEQYINPGKYEGAYNIGPDECDCITTGELVNIFCTNWGSEASWIDISENDAPHEAGYLKLDCSKVKQAFCWNPTWHINDAIKKTVLWSKAYINGEDVLKVTRNQIEEYFK